MNEAPVLSRPIPLKVLIDEAIRQLRRNFAALFPAIAIPLAFLSVPLTFLYFKRFSTLSSFLSSSEYTALSDVLVAMGAIGLAFAGLMAAHYAA